MSSNSNNNNNSGSDRKKGGPIKSNTKAFIKSAMAKYGKIQMCSPYGMSVTCICDSRGRIFRCMFPGMDHGDDDLTGEAMLSRDDRSDGGLNGLGASDEMSGLDGMASASHNRGLDEKTEIILAATFLVLIILAFISFVIYRCEKSYMRRRLQESFHMSPSSGGLICNGGLMSGLTGNGHSTQIPTISVSVQTEPQMLSTFGLANTSALLSNGGLQHQMNGNGNGSTNLHGNHAPVSVSSYNYSSTLPHLGGHLSTHHFSTLHSQGLGGGGGCLNGTSGLTHQDLCEDGVDPVVGLGGGGGHRHSIWSRDNLHAQSYRDMRDIVALPPPTSSSRDNTLSRDMHHINENGMRTSGTTENLRSPSVAGTAGRDDDDINTDYAESDVMINNDRQTNNSNGSGNDNNTGQQQQRYLP